MRALGQPNLAYLNDRGDADEGVRSALAASATGGRVEYLRALVALCGSRLLVPIVASGDDGGDGPDPDREAELAAVLVRAPDGRQGLLAFTGLDALQAWEPRARPVPGTLDNVAGTAAESGATALIIDVAGPTPYVIEADLLAELAQGRRLVATEGEGFAWVYASRA